MSSTAEQQKKLFDNRYEILGIIGRGSRSVVYRAKHSENQNLTFAIKVLLNDKDIDDTIERLRKEALAMVSSRHENTIRLEDFHTVDNISYLAMELAPEADLRQYMKKQQSKLSIKQIKQYFKQIASALSFMHDAGMIHRDIKPDNFLVMNESEVRLGDFGVTVLPGETPSFKELQRGVGTMDYMAPEVLEGKDYNAQSDVYSLGISFYELFSGKHPFEKTPLMQQLEIRKDGAIPNVKSLNSEIPDYIAEIIMRSISFEPKKRFDNARELLQALKAGDAKNKTTSSTKKRRRRRKKKTTQETPAKKEINDIENEINIINTPIEVISNEDNQITAKETNYPSEPTSASKEKNTEDDDFDKFLKELDEEFESELDKELEDLFKNDEKKTDNYDDLDAEIDRELEEILRELEAEEEAARKAEQEANLVKQSSMPSAANFNLEENTPQEEQKDNSEEDFFTSLDDENKVTDFDDNDQPIDSDIISQDHTIIGSSKKTGIRQVNNSYSLLYKLLGVLVLVFIYKFYFTGSSYEDQTSTNTKVSKTEKNTPNKTTEANQRIFPKFTGGEINFPVFPTGVYNGQIEGLISGKNTALDIISINNGNKLIVLLGIPGWKPAIINIDADNTEQFSSPLRIASNGVVILLSANNDEAKADSISGNFKNVISGATGTWSLKAE